MAYLSKSHKNYIMAPKATILLFFLVLYHFASAQIENLLVKGIDKQVEIKYQPGSKNKLNNEMIEMVAKAKALPVDATVLTYNVKEHQRIDKKNNNLQLELAVGNFVFPDSVRYLNFDINSFLTPGLINFTWVWSYDNDQVIETNSETGREFKNGSYLLKKSVPNTYESGAFKLYLSKLEFGFNESDVSKLRDYMGTVDAYYDADAHLNMIEKGLDKIRNDSIEMLETYKQTTIDNIKVLNQIRAQRFSSKLNLDIYDPIRFKTHFGQVEVRNREIRKDLEKTLDNMHVTYYLKGMDWLKWHDINRAKEYFEKSRAEKSSYPPPIYAMAKLDFDDGKYEAAIDSCSLILNKLKPDTDTRYNSVKLSESVIYKYLADVDSLINRGDFIKAMDKLTLCENYANSIPGVKKFSEFDEVHGKLFKAYYLQLVDVTNQQIKDKLLDEAQFNVDSLAEFRQLHSTDIINSDKENQLLKDLYSAWIEAGKTYMQNEVPDSSLHAFTQASIICHKYDVVYCTEELDSCLAKARVEGYNYMINTAKNLVEEQYADSALTLLEKAEIFRSQNNLEKYANIDEVYQTARQLKYSQLVRSGEEAYEKNQSREALAFYDEARKMEKNYKVATDTSLNGKIILAAQNYISLLCIQGETFIEALHVDDARQKLSEAGNVYNYYNLQSDKTSTQLIASLKEKLQSGKCDQVQFDFNVQIIAAHKFIEQKKFKYAWQAFENARKLHESNDDCQIVDTTPKEFIHEVKMMLNYQKQLSLVNEDIDNKEYTNALESYSKLTQYYHDSCAVNFGIRHQEFYPFIANNQNLGLVDYAVQYYAEAGKTDTSLMLLNVLCDKEYIASWSKESQIALGKQLALSDIEAEMDMDPKIKVIDYTKANKWFNYLKKAYLQEWKNR